MSRMNMPAVIFLSLIFFSFHPICGAEENEPLPQNSKEMIENCLAKNTNREETLKCLASRWTAMLMVKSSEIFKASGNIALSKKDLPNLGKLERALNDPNIDRVMFDYYNYCKNDLSFFINCKDCVEDPDFFKKAQDSTFEQFDLYLDASANLLGTKFLNGILFGIINVRTTPPPPKNTPPKQKSGRT